MRSASTYVRVESFFDPATGTVTHVVVEPDGPHCAVIDPVLDFEARSGTVSFDSLARVAGWIPERALRVQWILETHCHADHLSGTFQLKAMLGGRTGTGHGIAAVQDSVREAFNLGTTVPCDGASFDRLFHDGDAITLGSLTGRVLATPGHTPACVSYLLGDAAFVGDTLFMPDLGSARCDFPGGDAATLYRSARRLLSLSPHTRVFTGHDYPPAGRSPAWESSVAEQRERNIHVHDAATETRFVALRSARDRTLMPPSLMLPALQVNAYGGRLPPPESNGVSYLKLPVRTLPFPGEAP